MWLEMQLVEQLDVSPDYRGCLGREGGKEEMRFFFHHWLPKYNAVMQGDYIHAHVSPEQAPFSLPKRNNLIIVTQEGGYYRVHAMEPREQRTCLFRCPNTL